MPGKHLSVWLLLFILAGCTNGKDNPESKFQLQPVPGKGYKFAINTVTTSVSAFGITGDTTRFRFDISPRHIDTTGTTLHMVIHELRLAKRTVTLNTKSGMDHKLSNSMEKYLMDKRQILDSVSGDSLVLFVNKYGQLLMEDGLDELVKHVSEQTGIDETQVKLVVRDFLSPAAMKDLLTELFFYLPGKHIVERDTWVSNNILTALAPVKYSNMITVDSIETEIIYLNIKSQISAGSEGNIYMDGTRVGAIKADLKSGFPLSASFIDETVTRTTGGEIKKTRHIDLSCTIR